MELAARPQARPPAAVVAWLAGTATVGCQMAFPFTGGGTPGLTIVTVALFALAGVSHAFAHRGPVAAVLLVAIAGGMGWFVEAIGVRTGVPFGRYEYAGTLGPQLLDVPVVVALGWLMMAYPALLVGRVLAGGIVDGPARRPVAVGIGAWALASWDVFLDPQMIDAGHWRWLDPQPSLPGVAGVPLTNFAGWLFVALVLIALLDRALPSSATPGAWHVRAEDRLPVALYVWTYGSSVLANLVFFGRPAVALAGGIAMGVVAVPLALRLWRDLAQRDVRQLRGAR